MVNSILHHQIDETWSWTRPERRGNGSNCFKSGVAALSCHVMSCCHCHVDAARYWYPPGSAVINQSNAESAVDGQLPPLFMSALRNSLSRYIIFSWLPVLFALVIDSDYVDNGFRWLNTVSFSFRFHRAR